MDHMPLISVIVPVYNVQPYLEKALNSIIQQTLEDIQIILVDDGSDDGSLDICHELARKDERIQMGERLELDMFEYLYKNAILHEADISTCEIFREYPDGKTVSKGSHKDYMLMWMKAAEEMNYNGDFDAFLFNKIFRRSSMREIYFPEGVSIGEDYTFIIKSLLKHPVIFHGGVSKYHYRQQPNSISYTGFSNADSVLKNRNNYQKIYILQIREAPELQQSALAYYILQEMAVPISMVKAKRYNKSILSSVKQTIRSNLKRYIKAVNVPVYLKVCAVLLSINEIFLLLPYKVFFHRIRSLSEI